VRADSRARAAALGAARAGGRCRPQAATADQAEAGAAGSGGACGAAEAAVRREPAAADRCPGDETGRGHGS
jgi:hypothetical protein